MRSQGTRRAERQATKLPAQTTRTRVAPAPMQPTGAEANLLALQQTAGNEAVNALLAGQLSTPFVQRWALDDLSSERWRRVSSLQPAAVKAPPLSLQRWEMTELTLEFWKTQSKIFWDYRTAMEGIDAAVAKYEKVRELPARFAERIPILEELKAAITAWYKTAEGTGKRLPKIRELEGKVDAQLVVDRERKRKDDLELEAATAKHDVFHTMDPDMARFATRSRGDFKPTDSRFKQVTPGGIVDALTQPRGEGGALTKESIEMMSAYESRTLKQQNVIDKIARGSTGLDTGTLSKDKLKDVMAANVNELTKQTIYPELRNLTEPNTAADAEVTETIDMGGVSWQVTHNKSDVNLESKMGTIKGALAKVREGGFELPTLQLHIPKFGRKVTVSGDCQASSGNTTERAMFVAPNWLHISSDVLGNPILDKTEEGGKYKFSSTELDPSGMGTIVHEIGHALHFKQSPAKFHGLWGAIFNSPETLKKAEAQVSVYGGKPREMVAEVFLGLVYGKKYSEDVMEIYTAFGGPKPA